MDLLPHVSAEAVVFFLKEEPDARAGQEIFEEHEEALGEDSWLRCIGCGDRIASPSCRVPVEGKHEHHHVNPEGIRFHLGCFSEAPGAEPAGEATAYFCWFRGYSWQIALCRQCGLHLGWLFVSDSHFFFGLILTRLARGDA